MQVSVVIPTRNRKARLLSLLENLSKSSHPIHEVIIVDASDMALQCDEYAFAKRWPIHYLRSESAVCIQRNIGISAASAPWIFLCDDDIEVPCDYLQKLVAHLSAHPNAGAASGLFLQREQEAWTGTYPIRSTKELLLKFVFGLSIWGALEVRDSFFTRSIKDIYRRKGNHISKAGWPVITDFSTPYASVPAYTLGASIVRRDWLLAVPYDEVLDPHGIGDNYGVALGFPTQLHLVSDAFVYHYQEAGNRLHRPLQYYRRALALDHFIRTKPALKHVRRRWLLWSLFGNTLIFFAARDRLMRKPALKTFIRILTRSNPYTVAAKSGRKMVEATL